MQLFIDYFYNMNKATVSRRSSPILYVTKFYCAVNIYNVKYMRCTPLNLILLL